MVKTSKEAIYGLFHPADKDATRGDTLTAFLKFSLFPPVIFKFML